MIEKLVLSLGSTKSIDTEVLEKTRTEADYFERMRYPEFRRQHLFIGSGVIEAGCKTDGRKEVEARVVRGDLVFPGGGCCSRVTLAAGTTAPDASRTMPRMLPLPV